LDARPRRQIPKELLTAPLRFARLDRQTPPIDALCCTTLFRATDCGASARISRHVRGSEMTTAPRHLARPRESGDPAAPTQRHWIDAFGGMLSTRHTEHPYAFACLTDRSFTASPYTGGQETPRS